jgi:hypothetical protein
MSPDRPQIGISVVAAAAGPGVFNGKQKSIEILIKYVYLNQKVVS